MSRAYLHMVSSAPPRGKNDTYDSGPAMVAIAIEDEALEITRVIIRSIVPETGWKLDAPWMAKYGCGLRAQAEASLYSAVADEVLEALAERPLLVAHFVGFHARVLTKLIPSEHPVFQQSAFCTMQQATQHTRIPDRWGKAFNAPNLDEANAHFTGERLPDMTGLPWRESAAAYLTATRRVFWGIHRWGVAPAIELPA